MTMTVTDVETELVADVVGRFAASRRPGDQAVAEWAVNLALNSLRNGASASHACKQGRRVIERWTRLEGSVGGTVTALADLDKRQPQLRQPVLQRVAVGT